MHLAVDAHGMPVGMFVAAGPVADCTQAHRRVEGIELLADKGYDGNTGVELLEKRGIYPVIPPLGKDKNIRENTTKTCINYGVWQEILSWH